MSFRLKTIIGIALIEGVLLTILIVSGLWYFSNSAQKEFYERATSIADAFAVTTKDAVLSSDIASLESFVNEVLTYPGVEYARVVDDTGQTLAYAGDNLLRNTKFSEDYSFDDIEDNRLDKSAAIMESGVKFGSIQIGMTIDDLIAITQKAKQYGIGLGILEMLLVALFSFLLGGYLTRQLDSLSKASNEISNGRYGYQINVSGNDELARTARTFNLMSTQIKEAYSSLQDKEQYWREVYNSTLDAIIVINAQGEILSFNRGAELMFDYQSEEILGQNIAILVPEPHNKLHDDYIKKYKETGNAHVIGQEREFVINTRNNPALPINLRVTEMTYGDEPLFIGVIHDITRQKEYQENLKKSLSEKEILLKEVHHRVKNNMLIVSSILEMQEEHTDDPELIKVLKDCQERINSMAMIHQQFYRSDNLSDIDFTQYLEELLEKLLIAGRTKHKNIEIKTELANISLNVETATPLGLIVNEILSNCFEHAFENNETGLISVSLASTEKTGIVLCIEDNGTGLPENINFDEVESLGLQLIHLLSLQIDAKLDISSNNGTKICLSFTESQYKNRI
jgi:PAS domain S-box-containing protein